MATIVSPGLGSAVTLSSAQTGNADSTNIVDRGTRRGPGAVVIANTAGATPTVTVKILGSVDGTNYFNVGYSLVATPETVAVADLTITTTATTTYLLRPNMPWQFLKLNYSAITNETITATAYV